MFERSEVKFLRSKLEEPRKFIQVVCGPRHVGKTTLVRQMAEKLRIPVIYEVAGSLQGSNPDWIDQVWETTRIMMKAGRAIEYLLILDEIQRIPNWGLIVKKNWDDDTLNKINIKVILLGSYRQMSKEWLPVSLEGMTENTILGHWSYREMKEAFGWDPDTYAWFGGYPGSAALIKDEERWKEFVKDSLAETSISKDILMLTRIHKPALLRGLFELSCLNTGEVLSYTRMISQLHNAGNTTTLTGYLNLLSDEGLVTGLRKYPVRSIYARSSIPKLQVYNNALMSSHSIHNFRSVRDDPPAWSRITESAVGAYLACEAMKNKIKLYYWREGTDEVPFIIERQEKIIAIEFRTTFSAKRRGMAAFLEKFIPENTLTIDDKNLPWHEFIKLRSEELF